MASRKSKACVICMNDFNPTSRLTVALPCGHNFCLTCLDRLKASDSPVCPQCLQSFAEVELPGPARMAEASAKSKLVGCNEHEEPFVYWSTKRNELYCTTCILSADINTSCLKRIQDAIPLIEDDLERKARAVKTGLTSDLMNHTEERKKAVQELAKINTFEESILKLKADYEQFIDKVDAHNSKLRERSTSVNKIEEEISQRRREQDSEIVLSYMETLQGLHKPYACYQQEKNSRRHKEKRREYVRPSISSHRMMRPAKLLSDIACVFEEGEGQEAAFIQKLQREMERRNSKCASDSESDRSMSDRKSSW